MTDTRALADEGGRPEGVRERRNRELRQRIHLAAIELGEPAGMDAVTVAELAAAAGISRRTFFRHFRSKEDAVLAGHARYLAAARSLPMRARNVTEALSAIERVGDVVLEHEGQPELAEHRRVNAMIQRDQAIRTHAVVQDRLIADVFRDRLRELLPHEPVPALEFVADLGVTVWRHGWVRWSAQQDAATAESPVESHRAARQLFRAVAASATR